ncbi:MULTISPECIES: hypothetical protein [Vibrio]|uniref:Uncharacterized protein n=1 Tax=Vibrio splendidus TaxID=29497 RepID=A0A2T5EC44_VIBSP|nr:hypothetical protein [Vibrio splendidus]NWJ63650.1 hypothetical protein [Vibrio parahaemolyticus]NWK17321.1 hypothetical protein [Vibrio parahaemolyticus]OEE61379.1 hypothetical protein A147_20420 [Vibrio splendidus FF-6]PTP16890.1 hypothetical protein CWO36_18095 [Vibrio splendidus]
MKKLNEFDFQNEAHIAWLNNYLTHFQKHSVTGQEYLFFRVESLFLEEITEERFNNFLLEFSRESASDVLFISKLKAAWRKKRARDEAKRLGVTYYNLELSIGLKKRLETLSGNNSYQKTLENLIDGSFAKEQKIRNLSKEDRIVSFQNIEIVKLRERLKTKNEKISALESELEYLRGLISKERKE